MIHSRMPHCFHSCSSCFRDGDYWYVTVGKKIDEAFKAKAEVQSNCSPPLDGWKFRVGRTWKKDAGFKIAVMPLEPCCSITVALTGKAKETHPGCEGRYFALKGMRCRGRQVFSLKSLNINISPWMQGQTIGKVPSVCRCSRRREGRRRVPPTSTWL